MMKTPNGRAEIVATFGNPCNADGSLNQAWEDHSIVLVVPPDGWRLYYQGEGELLPSRGIRVHRLLAASLLDVLLDIWNRAAEDLSRELSRRPTQEEVRQRLHELRLDQHNGGYNFRPSRHGSVLSLHAYGIAIDWDADHNPMGHTGERSLPDWWYECWARRGWTDGRHFPTPDPMHVQFATGA